MGDAYGARCKRLTSDAPSALSLAAAGIYLLVAAAAALALWRAFVLRQTVWHRWTWAIIAMVFVGLALLRIFAVEELLRTDLRMTLYQEGAYDERRSFQGPLFAVVFTIAATGVAGLFYFLVKGVRGRRNIVTLVATGCTAGMIFLLALRLLSLHSVDELLYGPIKLNWFADLGMTVAALVSAVRYFLIVRPAPVSSPSRRSVT